MSDLNAYVDSKLEAGLRQIRQHVGRDLERLDENLAALLGRVESLEKGNNADWNQNQDTNVERNTRTQKSIKYKQIDLEARSRRNNLIFFNMPENEDENVSEKLRALFRDKLDIEDPVAIQRAHRLGHRKQPPDGKPRPVIACLRDYPDVDLIISRSGRLKGTRLGVSRDYPEEIRRARARLQADRRQARQDGKHAIIAYPAKLVVDGTVVRNEFPDWNMAMREGIRSDADDH